MQSASHHPTAVQASDQSPGGSCHVRAFLYRLRTTCQCCTQDLGAERKARCAVGECCQKQLSPSTVAYRHSVLKSALEHAVRENELPRSVARNVKAATSSPRRFRSLTAGEARQFLNAARERPNPRAVRNHPAHRTPQRRTPRPPRGRPRPQQRNGQCSPPRPAHSHPRPARPAHQVPCHRTPLRPTECINSLKTHQERQREERQAAATGWRDNGLAFATPTGRRLNPANLARRFSQLLHRVQLRTIRFHDLRHSTATLLLEQGVDLVVIKELLGHAHIGVTAGVYAHVQLRLQRDAIDTLSAALGGRETTKTVNSYGDEPPPCTKLVH